MNFVRPIATAAVLISLTACATPATTDTQTDNPSSATSDNASTHELLALPAEVTRYATLSDQPEYYPIPKQENFLTKSGKNTLTTKASQLPSMTGSAYITQ